MHGAPYATGFHSASLPEGIHMLGGSWYLFINERNLSAIVDVCMNTHPTDTSCTPRLGEAKTSKSLKTRAEYTLTLQPRGS